MAFFWNLGQNLWAGKTKMTLDFLSILLFGLFLAAYALLLYFVNGVEMYVFKSWLRDYLYIAKLVVAFIGLTFVAAIIWPFYALRTLWNYDELEYSRTLRERGF